MADHRISCVISGLNVVPKLSDVPAQPFFAAFATVCASVLLSVPVHGVVNNKLNLYSGYICLPLTGITEVTPPVPLKETPEHRV